MWYPNRSQWIAVWFFAVLLAVLWLGSADPDEFDGRLVVTVFGAGALTVWSLAGIGRPHPVEAVPEPATFNPAALLIRALSCRGCFTRLEFLVVVAADAALASAMVAVFSVALAGRGTPEWAEPAALALLLGSTVPILAGAMTRRLNDTGSPWWWLVLLPVPVIGFGVLLLLLIGKSSPDVRPREQLVDAGTAFMSLTLGAVVAFMLVGLTVVLDLF